MKIRAFIERENRERTVRAKGKVGDLLDSLGINPESVIVARKGNLVTEKSPLKEGGRLRIIHIKATD